MAARLARDLPPALRCPLSDEAARAQILHQLATRERRFLDVIRRAVYGNPRSPYLALLRHAGIAFGDIARLVERDGVEGTLQVLAEAGVYVTYDEFRGRTQAVRGSQRFTFRQTDFDNPLVRPHLIRYTGGSSGRPSRIGYSLAYLRERAATVATILETHGIERPVHAFWQPAPFVQSVICAMLGQPTLGWFYPLHPLPVLPRLAARYLALVGWLGGHRFALPSRNDLDDPERLLDWLAPRLHRDRPIVLWTMSSAAARLGHAASLAGRSLDGLACMVSGEPLTERRRHQIEASGARVIVGYGANEMSGLSSSCTTPIAPDDVHLMSDRFAAIQRPRAVSDDGLVVDSLSFSLLTPAATKIAINAELGDSARVEQRDCGCLLGQIGMRTHLSEIRSFEKFTGEGVTFVRSNLEQILDTVLPSEFGGTGFDYQLAEEEAPDGTTRTVLRVGPNVGTIDEELVRARLIEEIGKGNAQNGYHVRMWQQAGTLVIRRDRPIPTRGGKVLPFHLLGRADADRRVE